MPLRNLPGGTKKWLTLGRASKLLGVDTETLRSWAEEGQVEGELTAGGHRRLDRSSVERLIRERAREEISPRAQDQLRTSPLGDQTEQIVAAFGETSRLGGERAADPVAALAAGDRAALLESGRQLVGDVVAELDLDGATRENALEQARASSYDFGAQLARGQVGLTEAVGLFLEAREPFRPQLRALARRRALDPGQTSMLYDQASEALDQGLLSFIEGYQSAG